MDTFEQDFVAIRKKMEERTSWMDIFFFRYGGTDIKVMLDFMDDIKKRDLTKTMQHLKEWEEHLQQFILDARESKERFNKKQEVLKKQALQSSD
jgi:hypothetical protein